MTLLKKYYVKFAEEDIFTWWWRTVRNSGGLDQVIKQPRHVSWDCVFKTDQVRLKDIYIDLILRESLVIMQF